MNSITVMDYGSKYHQSILHPPRVCVQKAAFGFVDTAPSFLNMRLPR